MPRPTTLNSDQSSAGHVAGTVVDQTGAPVAGARVSLSHDSQSPAQESLTDEDGHFSLANVAPGTFRLEIAWAGFATQTFSGILRPGDLYTVPKITLAVATAVSEMRVVPTTTEMADDQIKMEEKQRALGIIPNFYVSYIPDAAPLTSKQKFELAWKMTIDPVNFGLTAAIAGVQQSQNDFSGYGQGAQGYAKRYGAVFADGAVDTLIGSAILPSIFKQDPRYFYKGTGSIHSRILYAMANAVICKGDNGHWETNYSGILGGLAAGGISNLYYPDKNRNGAALTVENTLIGIGATAATNLLQEFVIRKLTPGAAKAQSPAGEISTVPLPPGSQEQVNFAEPVNLPLTW